MKVSLASLLFFFLSQIGTGMGNCGLASVAMILNRYGNEISVEETRDIIGYKKPDGGTTIYELGYILDQYDILYEYVDTIEENSIMLMDTTFISNKTYSYNTLHYIYVLYEYDNSYVCHDPLGGANQIYLTKELKNAIVKTIKINNILFNEEFCNSDIYKSLSQ
jgi:ABC-type bacteriocin/lantibiotic exporter with double-glycine peptidase domain